MRPPATRLGTVTTGVLLGALALAGCRTDAPAGVAASNPAAPSVSQTTPKPTQRPPSGLTGSPAGIGRPQLAVKIDNTRSAHPQVGVGDADIVYVELVESHLTRLLAVFSSRLPAEVGPVRSARESDLELLEQYGKVTFAFSGASRGVQRLVDRAPVLDVRERPVPSAFFRSGRRPMPYNLFLRPKRALAAKPGAVATDIGLRFAAAAPQAGRASTGFSVRFGPAAKVAARYDGSRHIWRIEMDGRRRPTSGGSEVGPANVIVQYVQVRGSRFRDVLGYVSPRTLSTGAGDAVVFRDGRAIPARWSRPTRTDGTRFTGAGGTDVALRPGRTWILLVPRGTRLGS